MSNTIKSIDLQAVNEKISFITPFGERGTSTRSIIRDLNKKIAETNNQKGVDNLPEKQASTHFIVERATQILKNTKKPQLKSILEDWLKQNPFLTKYKEVETKVSKVGLFSNTAYPITFSRSPEKKNTIR